jgi:hypothetical protein
MTKKKKGRRKMEKMKIQATVPEKKDAEGKVVQALVGPYTIEIEVGSTAAEDIQMFGDSVVKSNFESNVAVTVQSNMRAGMKKGETQESMQTRLANYKPGIAVRGAVIDPVQAYLAQFAAATPETQAKMLADLKAKAKK